MKVSIITVCLNSEEYIEKTIRSVLNQTYDDIEYIIVDGMSTDNTLNIIEQYKPLFGERLKIISEKDNGLYDAMNKGIKYATGELIGIINSDDWYEFDAVKNVVKEYLKDRNSIIYGAMLLRIEDEISGIQIRQHSELSNGMISHSTVFVPKEVYLKIGTFNTGLKLAADYDLMLRMLSEKINFKYIPKIIANFRKGGISTKFARIYTNESIMLKKIYGYDLEAYSVNPKKNSQAKFFWNVLIKKLCKYKYENLYIYGIGSHTEELLNYIKSNSSIKIKGIIDKEKKIFEEVKYGYNVFKLEEVSNKADAIIISSESYEYIIYKRIKYLENKLDIYRIYGADSVEEANGIIKDFKIDK